MALEDVKAFYEKLANDQGFSRQIQLVNSKAECSQIVREAGFSFTPEEFEEYTSQLLEAGEDEGDLKDLSKQELEAVFGGASNYLGKPPLQQKYGVIRIPPPQAMYGVVRDPNLDWLSAN